MVQGKKIFLVIGARPNFMKIAPLYKALSKRDNVHPLIVFTGQHADDRMSEIFFRGLNIGESILRLKIAQSTDIHRFAHIMQEFSELLEKEQPALTVVVGDVDSSAACALSTFQKKMPLAHVEAGLRSFDLKMPEEVNRRMIDTVSNYLFVTEKSGIEHLKRERIEEEKVFFTGNLMIDSLVQSLEQIPTKKQEWNGKPYYLTTFHRPSNVDSMIGLQKVIDLLKLSASKKTVIFPMHPRTANNLRKFGMYEAVASIENLIILLPQGYLEFLGLMQKATVVLTDSGGIQEETTYLQVPCITLRNSTERPSTTEIGSNTLVKNFNLDKVERLLNEIEEGTYKKGGIPPLWDGKSAERTADVICEKVASYV